MSSTKLAALATAVVVVLAAPSCTCRGPALNSSHGELVVVLADPDGGELLARDVSFEVPGVAMEDVGTSPVLLRNLGTGPLTFTDVTRDGEAIFELSDLAGQVLEAGADLTATLRFSPPQDPDPSAASVPHEALFHLAMTGTLAAESTASLTVTGRALARDCYVPASLDFGAVPPGERSALPLLLQNGKLVTSTTTLADVQGADAASFGHDGASFDVPPGGSVEAPVWFAPVEERGYAASLVVQRGAGCAPATVSLTGRGLKQAIAYSPASLDFGKLPLGSSSKPQQVTISNQSNATLHVSGAAVGLPDFSLTSAPATVPPGGSATFVLICTPTTLGRRSDTFSFTLDTQPLTTGQVALTCQGGGPKISVVPQVLPMGGANLGSPGAVASIRRLTVQNVGTAPPSATDTSNNLFLGVSGRPPLISLVPTSAETSAAEFEVTIPSTYDPSRGLPAVLGSNSADLEVRFKPLTLGAKEIDIRLYSNDALTPTVTVHVTADALGSSQCAGVTFSPSGFSFGDVPRGSGTSRTVVATNLGQTPCLVSGIDLTPGTPSAFALVSPPVVTIPGDGQASLLVKLAIPPDASQGATLHGNLRLFTSATGAVLLPLDARVASCLVIAPTSLSFGATGLGCRSADLPLQLYNGCGTSLSLQSVGPVSGPFQFKAAIPDGGAVLTGTPFTLSGSFVPTGVGAATGSVTLNVTEAGIPRSAVVQISANGTATSGGSDDWTQGQGDVDILFVVDDSCSMADEQTALAANFKYFIQHATLTGSNFHLGVTTTDIFSVDGALKGNPAFLTPATVNLSAEFSSRAIVGTGGSGFEQPFEGLLRAVTAPRSTTTNAGFLRDGVPLAAVIVTDAQEQSPKPVATYLAQLLAVKGNRLDLLNVSVVGPFTQPAGCMLDSTIDQGRYLELIGDTHGAMGDICTADWAVDLDAIGKNVLGLNTRFTITGTSSGPPAVTVDGVATTLWTWDAKTQTIIFAKPPAPNAHISASYQTVCNAP